MIQAVAALPSAPAAAPARKSESDPTPADTVRLSYNAQDPLALPAGEIRLPRASVGTRLQGPRLESKDRSLPTPDADGNFLAAQGTRGFQQASSFASATKTLQLFEGAVGHEIPWAFRGRLGVQPHAGDGFNAYYSRSDESINFFDGSDPKLGKTIHASESLEIVSHEAGHAILDGMKPGLLGWFGGVECEAFHESFGDVAAILTTLQDPAVLDRLIEQTGGDLHQDNVVAHLAEELSRGINDTALGGSKPESWTIRNANNPLRYQNPKGLPDRPEDDDQLGKEPHNFSRLFTAAAWDILAGLVERNVAQGQSPRDAIASARDQMLPLFARTVELGPNRMKKYRQMADAMVKADERYCGGANQSLIVDVFARRGIRPATVEAESVPDVQLELPITTLRDAARELFLQRSSLGIPEDVPLQPQAVTRNDRGETLVRYGYVEEVALDKRTVTDLGGSLTLGFDADGRLFHRAWEPVDDEQIELAREGVAWHAREGDLRDGAPRTADERLKADGHPYAGYFVEAAGRRKLIRVPATN